MYQWFLAHWFFFILSSLLDCFITASFIILASATDLKQSAVLLFSSIAWEASVFGVFLVRIFQHSDWIRENTDQKKSEYGHFSRSVPVLAILKRDQGLLSLGAQWLYILAVIVFFICGALRNLVPFVQFKKREKHSWNEC